MLNKLPSRMDVPCVAIPFLCDPGMKRMHPFSTSASSIAIQAVCAIGGSRPQYAMSWCHATNFFASGSGYLQKKWVDNSITSSPITACITSKMRASVASCQMNTSSKCRPCKPIWHFSLPSRASNASKDMRNRPISRSENTSTCVKNPCASYLSAIASKAMVSSFRKRVRATRRARAQMTDSGYRVRPRPRGLPSSGEMRHPHRSPTRRRGH